MGVNLNRHLSTSLELSISCQFSTLSFPPPSSPPLPCLATIWKDPTFAHVGIQVLSHVRSENCHSRCKSLSPFVWYFTIHFGSLNLLSVATSNVLFGYHTFLLQCLKLKLFILARLWQSMMAIHLYTKGLKTVLALFLHVQAVQKEQIVCNWRRQPWFLFDIWGFIQIRFNIVLIRTHNIEQR